MFFYNNSFKLSLASYGIFVPMLDSRIDKIRDYLDFACPDHVISTLPKFDRSDLNYAHSAEYILNLDKEPEKEIISTYELYNSDGSYNRYDPSKSDHRLDQLLNPILAQCQGTFEATSYAFENGFSFNLGGGLHHAMTGQGRGFCLVNDIVMSAKKQIAQNPRINHVWIIDVDAHKGDGTAEMTFKDSSITTLSIHMAKGWPLDSGSANSPWFIPSNIDIPIEQDEEALYIKKLESGLIDLSSNYPHADLAIIVQGSDPYEKDGLPGSSLLALSKHQMLERDLLVYNFLKNLNIPQCYLLSGGYGPFAHEVYIQFLDSIKTEIGIK